ncbi:MAG: hypothetical protein NYU39_00255, partial [Aigarchaeota archaeon]|nr:hypothetical protein [Candidatus Caldarchaeales archaeon]
DRWGLKVVALVIPLSVLPTVFIYSDMSLLMVSAFLLGVVIGAQESIFRAMVAELAQDNGLGSAYASYGLAFGVGAAVAGAVYGYMIQTSMSISELVLYAVAMQAGSAALLFKTAELRK